MLPRTKRLSRESFDTIAAGKRAISAHFSVTVRASLEGQAAVVVSKKIAKKSVDRHLLKRRALEILAPFVRQGVSFIVYARKGSETLSFPLLERELRELLTTSTKV